MADFDIAIIGAGLAGLSAANHLVTSSHPKIALIEARDRVGGRTNSIPSTKIPSEYIDIGGQWVGPLQDTVLSLIKYFKLELIEQEFSDATEAGGDESERLVECANFGFNPLTTEEVQEVNEFKSLVDDVASRLELTAPWNLREANEFDSYSVTGYVEKHIKSTGARV